MATLRDCFVNVRINFYAGEIEGKSSNTQYIQCRQSVAQMLVFNFSYS